MTTEIVALTQSKLSELLEQVQKFSATHYQTFMSSPVAEVAQEQLKGTAQKAQVFLAEVDAQLKKIYEGLESAYQTQIPEQHRQKIEEAIEYIKNLSAVLRKAVQSIHTASTSVSAQLQLDERRRQVRDEVSATLKWSTEKLADVQALLQGTREQAMEKVTKAKADAAHVIAKTQERATEYAAAAQTRATEYATERKDEAERMYADHVKPRIADAAGFVERKCPEAHAKATDGLAELQQADAAFTTRVRAAAALFLQAIMLFVFAMLGMQPAISEKTSAAAPASKTIDPVSPQAAEPAEAEAESEGEVCDDIEDDDGNADGEDDVRVRTAGESPGDATDPITA
eukprot:TRINITY_DN3011_c0_g1_i1.p1 TRINITY_DN3011_c0_g1~~TRINITY_DN3011_c0_g1_i1.p1  ORF type:complete len:343 (+),score=131.76 TRINITY_DN3011_c0_g1_i1:80-1108(+)